MYFLLGIVYYELNQIKKSIIYYKLALKIDPKSINIILNLANANYVIGNFLSAKSLSINFSIPLIVNPDLAIPACPITPDNLNVGILISFEKNLLNTRLNSKS